MGIEYKKTKDRLILPRGPRDIQRRQLMEAKSDNSQVELLESLRSQIKSLQKQLELRPLITDEQFDNQVIIAVREETVKHKEHIVKLENENKVLKSNIQNKDILIEQLKQIKVVNTEKDTYDKVEVDHVYVDPIEKDFVPLETNIEVDTSLTVSKNGMNDKVNKLKELLGKR